MRELRFQHAADARGTKLGKDEPAFAGGQRIIRRLVAAGISLGKDELAFAGGQSVSVP